MLHLVAWLGGLAILLVPGFALGLLIARRPSTDRGVAAAVWIALGLSFWPLLFLVTSTAGIEWSAPGVRILAVALLTVAGLAAWRRRRELIFRMPPATLVTAFFAALFGLTVATRLLHIRWIAAPLWVDSVHHTMIVRLFLERGAIPTSYEPFIENSVFFYHWGFHVPVAVLAWLTGLTGPFDVADLLLGYGQLLNALVFVAMYAAGQVLFGSRMAGVLTATLACLVSYFPAYYVSWGRYTHLAGVLLLPALGIALYRAGVRRSWRTVVPLAVLAAGMVLVHVRIAVFAATFSLALLLVVFRRRAGRVMITWAVAAGLALLATSPWLFTLSRASVARRLVAPPAAERGLWETPNQVPPDLLWAPNNVPLMVAASGGGVAFLPTRQIPLLWRVVAALWWCALGYALYRRWSARQPAPHAFAVRMLLVVTWCAVTILLINTQWVGLPRLRPLPNSAAIITAFVPLSLLAAGLARWLVWTVSPLHPTKVLAGLTVAVGLAGAWTTRSVINPVTVLVHHADVRALRWIRENTPASALFAVGVQPWLPGAYVGMDGGYWIPVLAERRSILPPGLYPWTIGVDELERVNHRIETWAAASLHQGDPVELLRTIGVTHVYLGPRNESPMRAILSAHPEVHHVFQDGAGADVLELRGSPP